MDRVELTNDGPAPGFQHLSHRHVVRHGEHEVEIRPLIPLIVCKRAEDSAADHSGVRRRHVQDPIP